MVFRRPRQADVTVQIRVSASEKKVKENERLRKEVKAIEDRLRGKYHMPRG